MFEWSSNCATTFKLDRDIFALIQSQLKQLFQTMDGDPVICKETLRSLIYNDNGISNDSKHQKYKD